MSLKIAIIGNDFNSSHPVFTRVPQALDEAAAVVDVGLSQQVFPTDEFSKSTDALKGLIKIRAGYRTNIQFHRRQKLLYAFYNFRLRLIHKTNRQAIVIH